MHIVLFTYVLQVNDGKKKTPKTNLWVFSFCDFPTVLAIVTKHCSLHSQPSSFQQLIVSLLSAHLLATSVICWEYTQQLAEQLIQLGTS